MKLNLKKVMSIVYKLIVLSIIVGVIFVLINYLPINLLNQSQKKSPIYRVETDEKKIALSFDVAWGNDNIHQILNILEKHKVKSSFFLVGNWVDENEDLVKEIDKRGHEIGNHSDTHAKMIELNEMDVIQEIESTSEKIENLIGKRPYIYRPPFGEFDDKTLDIYESLGYQTIKWDVDSTDWEQIGSNHIINKVKKDVNPGSIVLFHTNVEYTSQYLDKIIKDLKEEGYEIVPVSELIYTDNYIIDKKGTQKYIE